LATETHTTSSRAARSVWAIALNQAPQIIGAILYIALIPRTLGAEVYGQFAFVFAIFAIFQMLGELGYQEIFSRFVPEVRQHSGEAGVRAMFRALFGVKLVIGLGLGVSATLVALFLATWLTPLHALLLGLAVMARVWTMVAFPLLLGLGETLKWSVETAWRQIVMTFLLLGIVQTHSLTLVLSAMLADEVLFLALGLWWVRGWFGNWTLSEREVGRSLSGKLEVGIWDLLRFGLTFALANFALTLMFRISPIVVEKLTGSRTEVGFLDLAQGGLLLIYALLGQVAYAFVPILTHAHLAGRANEMPLWLGRIVRYSGLLVALAAGGMLAVAGPIAPILFGKGFEPAANTMRAVAIGLLPLPIAWVSVVMSAVEKRPAHSVRAAFTGLIVFLAASFALKGYASAGIGFAFGLGLTGYAIGFGANAGRAVRAGGVGWGVTVGAASLFLVFLIFPIQSLFLALVAWAGVALLYTLAIFSLRVVTFGEVRQILRALRR